MDQGITYFKFYNKALENLVEGQREVANNPDFEFDDGTTVEERMESLRARLRTVKSGWIGKRKK